jgi:hypothetical protein
MRKPIPVIISRNITESWSTWNANGMWSVSKLIKLYRYSTPVWPFLTLRNKMMLRMKEANTVPQPRMPANDLEMTDLPRPLIRKPINGIKGIRKTNLFIVDLKLRTRIPSGFPGGLVL